MVIAWPPAGARALGAARGYLPANVPLVKHVAAVAGDRACAAGEALSVNGRPAGLRVASDPSGRPLLWWNGCQDLGEGELLLLAPGGGHAFDGRYFGITRRHEVVGRAILLWQP